MRLWDKGEAIDSLMHDLTVGNDPTLDMELVTWDCLASAAHASMLNRIGILSDADTGALLFELSQVYELGKKREFPIPHELEEVHTAIELALVDRLGEAGRRIHTGRSRNDQVLTAMRLYLRSSVESWLSRLVEFGNILGNRFSELADVPMPGYTHLQPAMPSSVGMWLHSVLEWTLSLLRTGMFLRGELNVCPLGAAAGFGASLPLDREYVAGLLGFSGVQRSPIDANNSRGRYEQSVLNWAVEVAWMFEKYASDIMLFTTREFGFFALPNELTTGSSIMPQKRNCDIVELLRARSGKIRGAAAELSFITAKLPSSYHRDLQYTKEPVIRAVSELGAMFDMGSLVFARFDVNRDRLNAAMYDDLYATYEAYRQVQAGLPFRDAYRLVAGMVKEGRLDRNALQADFEMIQQATKSSFGTAVVELTKLGEVVSSYQGIEAVLAAKVFTGK